MTDRSPRPEPVLPAFSSPTLAAFDTYLKSLPKAVNESQKRHAFTILAATGFDDSELATNIALGSEYKIRFSQAGLVRRGAIDSYFGNLIIEFEHQLAATRNHALDQLRGYVAGAWTEDGSTSRPYLAVASDGLNWEVFTPRLAPGRPVAPENITLQAADAWRPSGDNDAEELRQFLNRLFFRKFMLPPTAANFARDFGRRAHALSASPAFVAATDLLRLKYGELENDPQLHVLQSAWLTSLELAYGSAERDAELFIRHTYLANLARLLVWASIERRPPSASEIGDILNGKYFQSRNIANLVEDDFFRWPEIESQTNAGRAWEALGRHLAGYELSGVSEDVLKPLYEQLVDPESRHDLGEYYTPDWLATVVTKALLAPWDWTAGAPRVLDPTCGSGTFIRCAIEEIRSSINLDGAPLLEALLTSVVGIDVHPLAVVIARSTYALAIKDLLRTSDVRITLPIYLANSLLLAEVEWTPSLFEQTFPLQVGNEQFEVPLEFVRSGVVYDATLDDVLAVAKSFAQSTKSETEVLDADVQHSLSVRVAERLDEFPDHARLLVILARMSQRLAILIHSRKDTIYGFLLRNHYRPAMLRKSFDYVVGNPPWLTINDIATPEYKDLVMTEADRYHIAPHGAGERGHTELATIFLAHIVAVFLRSQGSADEARVALVMPRSIFNGTQHRLLREKSYAVAMDICSLWDLEDIAPLFGVPACVVFAAAKSPANRAAIPGMEWRGRLPEKDQSWEEAASRVTAISSAYELAFLGRRSAWRKVSSGSIGAAAGETIVTRQPYADRFRQGAVLYPQTLMIVRPVGLLSATMKSVLVQSDPAAARTAKIQTSPVNHIVNTENLYRTAAAEHVLPFALSRPLWLAVLPTFGRPGTKFEPASPNELQREGLVESAAWLQFAQDEWERVRKAGDTSQLYQRLNHMNHLKEQAAMKRFVVLYTAAGSRPVATVLDTNDTDFPFVARDMTYWASAEAREEVDYLACFLNSDFALSQIKDWMTRGLFGPRHIHKRVLDIPWPLFDQATATHARLAAIGLELATHAQLSSTQMDKVPASKRRQWIRTRLPISLVSEQEQLVATISESVPAYLKK